MAAKQYELDSSVLDWYRGFCPDNSFNVEIRPDITFADVVVGMSSGIMLDSLIGSDDEVFMYIVFVKLAEITGESFQTVFDVWYEAPMNIDWVDEDERRLVAAAKRVVESRFEPISISDIDAEKAFDIANRAMLNEIMLSCGPIEYGLAEQVLPNLNWGSDTVATDAINEFIRRDRDGKIDPEAVRSHATELFAACQVQLAFMQADFILQACRGKIEPAEEMEFCSVYTPQPNFHLDILDDCVSSLRNPAFSAVKEAVADIEKRSEAMNTTPRTVLDPVIAPADADAADKKAGGTTVKSIPDPTANLVGDNFSVITASLSSPLFKVPFHNCGTRDDYGIGCCATHDGVSYYAKAWPIEEHDGWWGVAMGSFTFDENFAGNGIDYVSPDALSKIMGYYGYHDSQSFLNCNLDIWADELVDIVCCELFGTKSSEALVLSPLADKESVLQLFRTFSEKAGDRIGDGLLNSLRAEMESEERFAHAKPVKDADLTNKTLSPAEIAAAVKKAVGVNVSVGVDGGGKHI